VLDTVTSQLGLAEQEDAMLKKDLSSLLIRLTSLAAELTQTNLQWNVTELTLNTTLTRLAEAE
jgi:hypothetical protein